jgi:hypothetical protein
MVKPLKIPSLAWVTFMGQKGDPLFFFLFLMTIVLCLRPFFYSKSPRLWQIMFSHYLCQGRLSELVGEKALKSDMYLRLMRFAARAKG